MSNICVLYTLPYLIILIILIMQCCWVVQVLGHTAAFAAAIRQEEAEEAGAGLQPHTAAAGCCIGPCLALAALPALAATPFPDFLQAAHSNEAGALEQAAGRLMCMGCFACGCCM
jgi:hypothetical protein